MLRASGLVILLAAAMPAPAQEVQVGAAGQAMQRLGMFAAAERIVHRGERYLLVSLRTQEARLVDMGEGRTDWRRYSRRATDFHPVEVACDAAILHAGGDALRALSLSPCYGTALIAAPLSAPLFVVFRDPGPGNVRVTIPVQVRPKRVPVPVRLHAPAPAHDAAVPESLLALRELEVRLQVRGPR